VNPASQLLQAFQRPLPDLLIGILSYAIFVMGLAAVGLKVLLTSDPDWGGGPDQCGV
jgi:hypothetical protein